MVFYPEVGAVIRNEQGPKCCNADIRVNDPKNLELSNVLDLYSHQQQPLSPSQRSMTPLAGRATSTAVGVGFLPAASWTIASILIQQSLNMGVNISPSSLHVQRIAGVG